jgi:serine/threonine-protein kinase
VRDADAEASQREAADPSRPITAPGRPTPTVAVSVPSRETAVPERLIGKTVGRYHLKEFLGGGGAGLAFSAWDADRRQAACLKLFFPQPDGFHAEETTRTVFAALVRIDHPSIVKPMDVGRFDWEGVGTHYLAMELIDGEPLDVWLRSAPPATDSLAPRLTIAAALTDGLHAAHSCRYAGKSGIQSVGLVHGDVKPTNVMLRRDGTPVLLDFLDFRQGGRPPATEEELEGTDSCTMEMGTPGFMAPEQERQGIITFASDIYSLGLVVQQLLGYPGTTLRPAWVPAALHELVASMTARSPEARPTDLLALAQQLREAAAPPRGLWAKAVGLFRAPGAGGR